MQDDVFDPDVRLAKLRAAAIEMMSGNESAAINWLNEPKEVLGGESPIIHAATARGAREVQDLIGRIRHGVFS
ncbi:antitoxin Xre/MbcA/ParS toxin-binding domain-containing protein [Zhongshania sp.]|jgi:putative toxin-antitoxin system antitoxin component (TIGR02293 family)|uniref:antitoxin Xre/MbcA/ParS toxin-binding domain-containing protein n=1 Tax=Zhongshania sp. TaxID=1971902 RepID=UPI0039E643FD